MKVNLKKIKNNSCQPHITSMLQKYLEEEYKKAGSLNLFQKGQLCFYFQVLS